MIKDNNSINNNNSSNNNITNTLFNDIPNINPLIHHSSQLFKYPYISRTQLKLLNNIENKKIIINSKPGSGKTFAFIMKILNEIDLSNNSLQVIVVSASRELALQTKQSYFDKLEYSISNFSSKLCIGGEKIKMTNKDNNSVINCQVLVSTLGKLQYLFSNLLKKERKRNKKNSTYKKKSMSNNGKSNITNTDSNGFLNNIKLVVFDEFDKLTQQNKSNQLDFIINSLIGSDSGNKRSYVLCSTTVDDDSIKYFSKFFNLKNFCYINNSNNSTANNVSISEIKEDQLNQVTSNDNEYIYKKHIKDINNYSNILQFYKHFENKNKETIFEQKYSYLFEILSELRYNQCIVFYNSKSLGEELVLDLRNEGYSVIHIHGDYSQEQRKSMFASFRNKHTKILLTTDLFSRGIDVQMVDLVINFDCPLNMKDYIHRIGRTGRFESQGVAINLVNSNELERIKSINKKDFETNFICASDTNTNNNKDNKELVVNVIKLSKIEISNETMNETMLKCLINKESSIKEANGRKLIIEIDEENKYNSLNKINQILEKIILKNKEIQNNCSIKVDSGDKSINNSDNKNIDDKINNNYDLAINDNIKPKYEDDHNPKKINYSLLKNKRRRIKFHNESKIGEWVDSNIATTTIGNNSNINPQFQYYVDSKKNKSLLSNNNKNEFCLYCNLIKHLENFI